jgi:DNA-binding NarL/FixJ family response regulator
LTLTPQQRQRIRDLFRLIAVENDPERVQALAGELARLVVVQAPFREPSDAQLRIIELVAKGLKNREIAGRLGMSSNVVRNYISKIYDEVGVHNRVQLALWYEARLHEQKLSHRSN